MTRKKSSIRMIVPHLPYEIKAMIIKFISYDRDLTTLNNVLNTDNLFSNLARKHIYHHIDFRRKSPVAIRLFAKSIAPLIGHTVLSIAHRPINEDAVERSGNRLTYLRERDIEFANVFKLCPNVVNVDLTVPTLDFESLYGSTIQVILSWRLSALTCRSKDWGRGKGFNSATDAFNARSLAILLSSYPGLSSFRALGISGLDVSPDGPSIRALRLIPHLNHLTSVHLAGGWLHEFTPHFVRLSPPLTHLVIAEDSEMEWEELHELLLTVGQTLESLAIRQAGQLIDDPKLPDFTPAEFPRLRRIALCFDGEILQSINRFVALPLHRLEIGTDDGKMAGVLTRRLKDDGCFPGLKELGFVSAMIEGNGWEELQLCLAKLNILCDPGFTTSDDFPPCR